MPRTTSVEQLSRPSHRGLHVPPSLTVAVHLATLQAQTKVSPQSDEVELEDDVALVSQKGKPPGQNAMAVPPAVVQSVAVNAMVPVEAVDDCSICLELINEDHVQAGCGHSFHRCCLESWRDSYQPWPKGLHCPFCRSGLTFEFEVGEPHNSASAWSSGRSDQARLAKRASALLYGSAFLYIGWWYTSSLIHGITHRAV